jgi:salicylate hydroxylase
VRLLLRLAHLLFAWLGRVLRVRVGITKTHLWHDVRDALRARVCELHGAGAIHADHDLISLKEEEEALVLGFNVSGELREVRCRALFACDGTRSRVRELSPDAPCLLDEGKSVWRGVAPAYDCSGAATFYRDASGSSGLLFPAGRGGGTSWTVIAPVVPGRSETQDESRARLRDALPTRVDECLLNVIAESPLVIENKLVTRDWSKPWASSLLRVAYLGDAAHPLRPTGEGTALAFEDAYTIGHLARDLGGVGPELMRAYEQARLGRVRAVSDAVKAAAEGFYKPDSDAPAETPLSVAAAMRRFPMRYKRLGTVRGAREG